MDYKIQLISFIASFLYGVFFCIFNMFNEYLIRNYKPFFKYLVTFLFILNMVLLFIILIYKINYGIFHLYFIAMVVIGYVLGVCVIKKYKDNVKSLKIYRKFKK